MTFRFLQGKRYRATIDRKITSPTALGLVRHQLEASGFHDIKFEQTKTGTVIEGTWANCTGDIEVAFDVRDVRLVA